MNILLAEDDAMLADCLAEMLVSHGHSVCGVAATVAEGVALARLHRPEIAILDMQMRQGESGSDIVEQLAASDDLGHMGVLYVTGGIERVWREARIGHACLGKPYRQSDLIAALDIVRDIAQGGGSSRPLPRKLRLMPPSRGFVSTGAA